MLLKSECSRHFPLTASCRPRYTNPGGETAFPIALPEAGKGYATGKIGFPARSDTVDFWRKSNKPPFDSLQSFLGLHFASGIVARSAVSPDLTKNQPIGP
jgi:hypothetical protein